MTTNTVLITGITGFVGAYLTRKLIHEGHAVFGLYRHRSDGFKPILLKSFDLLDDIKLIEGDIMNLTSLLDAVQQTEPDWIFHLAAQSFVPKSIRDPLGTFHTNCLGTHNILEAVRLRRPECKIIYAGSSEEYGLQFIDQDHYAKMQLKYGSNSIEPPPTKFPELPIDEQGSLRPLSPYATSKVYGDFLMRNYHLTYGANTIVSRAFNHEGAGRGHEFVTSSIVRQVVTVDREEQETIQIGDITPFRDWSHVEDIVDGYILLAKSGTIGAVYVQGSMRTNSVLTYILKTIASLGYQVQSISSVVDGSKMIRDPLEETDTQLRRLTLKTTKIDCLTLKGSPIFGIEDNGLLVLTDKKKFTISFDKEKFRPSDVPILMANNHKISRIGYKAKKKLEDIINSQVNYYLDPANRKEVL